MAQPVDEFPSARAARRRHLTLVFSDLSDSTTMAVSLEPEHYLEVLAHLRRCAHTIIPKHGGTLIDFRGDGFLAMFGFPEPSEHDARRAIEATLELHEAIAQRPEASMPVLSMHSGIHSGLVLLIESAAVTGGYALVGEATNIAARLSDAAARHEILVSATTLGTESHFFHIRERGELSLPGKTITAYQVLGRSSVSTRFEARSRRGLTPFVGRDQELALLDAALRQSMTGRIRTVTVVGDAGVGKTRLIQEFLRNSASVGCAVYKGYCDDYRTAEPLQPFLQILRTMCGLDSGTPFALSVDELEEKIRGSEELLGIRLELVRAVSLTLAVKPAAQVHETPAAGVPDAIRHLVMALAARRPLILFIDDWQWADDASRQVLAAVREPAHKPVLIVTTSRTRARDEGALHESELRLVLAPLGEEHAIETIRALRPNADPFLVRRFQQNSGGNPLFIEELCHSHEPIAAEGHIERATTGPAWLGTLIESRVARLPHDMADLVRTAAVIGFVIPAWLLQQLTGFGQDDPIVRELAEKDLIFPAEGGTLRFKHGVTREVVYQSVGLHERQRTHLRIAQLLRERCLHESHEELFEPLAYHYRAAAEPHLAAEYAERAGDKALGAAALDRARAQYCAALELLEPSETAYFRWISIAQRLGLACIYDPARDQLPIFARAVEIAASRGDQAALAKSEYWLGYINYALGDASAAIDHCERAREHCARAMAAAVGTTDTTRIELEALAVQILATLGQARAAAGEHDRALEQLDEAIGIKRQHRTGRRPAVGFAYTLACKAWVLGDRGRFADAHECFAESIAAVPGDTQPVRASITGWQGAVYLWQGRWAEARAAAREAQRVAERVGSLYIFAMNQALGEYARWMLDRSPDAIEPMVRATSWLEARDKRLFISLSYGWLAEVMLGTARYPQARHYAARALRRARERDRWGEAMAYRVLARLPVAHRRHSPDYYLNAAMKSAQARCSPQEEAVTLLDRAQIAAAVGRETEAAASIARASAAFSAMDMSWHLRQSELISAALRLPRHHLTAPHPPPQGRAGKA
jgi:class 3 adenylate cyclase/tetratricopeptide (TPR) repeat protein